MSQWGSPKTFVMGRLQVKLIPHVLTDAFDPITDASIIDELYLMGQPVRPNVSAEAVARFIIRIKEKYEKKPYRNWFVEEMICTHQWGALEKNTCIHCGIVPT